MSTTSAGNALRDYVLSLLKSKFPDAQSESKAEWKNADIIFSMMELGKRIRVAVECKNYSRALKTSDFSSVIMGYQSAIESGAINLLLVVSNKPVEAASRKLIETTRTLRFMTLTELESWIVGLEPYVEALAEEFNTDEVHKYYVEGRFEGTEGTAFDHVLTWINSPEETNTGLAILGGYGIGKSSLAKRLASAQAVRYLQNPEKERLPILLPLGQVVHETELAGLFGKYFTSRFALENYSYKALLRLNAAGRLLIIFDGFDEMKHAMTEHDFRANFREFNKLRVPKSKVLLLGRPTAFTSESASLLVRGLAEHGGQIYSDTDFPAWDEKRLEFFTVTEQARFLDGFLKYKSPTLSDEKVRKDRIVEVMKDIDEDILQRPVQARIVGLLAADPNYKFKGTNRFRLYGDFVQQVIRRDQEKRARSLIPTQDRHKFLRELAWWAWTRPGVSQGTFRREEVPDSLFLGLSAGEAIDHIAKRTEYLVSSLTEEKDSNFLYFAHRSFHEFLVASHLTSLVEISDNVIESIGDALSEQVIDFLKESENQEYLKLLYDAFTEATTAPTTLSLADLLTSSNQLITLISQKPLSKITPLDVFVVGRNKHIDDTKRRTWLGNVITKCEQDAADAAAYHYLDQILKSEDSAPSLTTEFLSKAWERVFSESLVFEKEEILIEEERFCAIYEILKSWTRKLKLLSGHKLLFNVTDAKILLSQSLAAIGFVGLPPPNTKRKLEEIEVGLLERSMSKAASEKFKELYAMNTDIFSLNRDEFTQKRKKKPGVRKVG